mmetsp:Transcript_21291/g.32313  ORF Transcript_21291/g.32313 Transcript_21291/m.32313 type:complete len:290 (+) Transcript_21291:2-871(+)
MECKTIRYTEPNPEDVLCGRSNLAFHHVGNRDLRVKIAATLDEYNKCPTRHGKTVLIRNTIKFVAKRGGRFLKYDKHNDKWYDGGSETAKIRVSTAFRDARIPNKVKCMEALSSSSRQQQEGKEKQAHRGKSPLRPRSYAASRRKNIKSSATQQMGKDRRRSSLSNSILESIMKPSELRSSSPYAISSVLEPIPLPLAEPEQCSSSDRFTGTQPQSSSESSLDNHYIDSSPRSSITNITPILISGSDMIVQDDDDLASVTSSMLDGIDHIDDFGSPTEDCIHAFDPLPL